MDKSKYLIPDDRLDNLITINLLAADLDQAAGRKELMQDRRQTAWLLMELRNFRKRMKSDHYWLIMSQAERNIMTLWVNGYTSKQIAAKLIKAHNTIKTQIKSAYKKMGIHTKEEAIFILLERD